MRALIVCLLLALAGSLTPLAASNAAPDSPDGPTVDVSYAGCEGWGAWLAAPLDRVRPHVPSEFTIRGEAAGVAQIGMVAVRCPTLVVAGTPAPGNNYFVLFADLDSHVGSYDILEITDSPAWQGGMRVVDKASDLADAFTLEHVRVGGDVVGGDAYLEHAGGWIRSTARLAVGAPMMQAPMGSFHWYKGQHGIVEAVHDNWIDRAGAAAITFEFAPGALPAEVLGVTTIAAPGLLLEYGATATFVAHGS